MKFESGGRRDGSSPSLLSGADLLRWRVIQDPARPGPVNMALDHGLAHSLRPGTGVLRFYEWIVPTVSFGKNEPSRGLYSLDEAERQGVAFVRRPTGGRAVLHHLELTYALVFPVGSFSGLKKAYRLINQGLGRGLELLGATVQLASPSGPSLPPDAGPCFREPTEGEVTALGRKLVGSAQVRLGPAVLQHGSIILDGDQGLLGRLRRDGQSVPPPATLRGVLGSMPDGGLLRSSIRKGLEEVLGGGWEDSDYRPDEKMAARGLEGHYGDAGWTWRL